MRELYRFCDNPFRHGIRNFMSTVEKAQRYKDAMSMQLRVVKKEQDGS